MLKKFSKTVTNQRNDDDRYYHQSTWNQTFHLISAFGFLFCYFLLFKGRIADAGILAWLIQIPRQCGHFFFEKHTYDVIHGMSHEEKESIKPGYNLKRKKILIVIIFCGLLFSIFNANSSSVYDSIGHSCVVISLLAYIIRIVTLSIQSSPIEGLAWGYKILTDPFNDIRIYMKSPLKLFRGQFYETKESLEERLKKND